MSQFKAVSVDEREVKKQKRGNARVKSSERGVTELLAKAKARSNGDAQQIRIKPLRQKVIALKITGTAPYMQMRFSKKAAEKMRATQEAGSQGRSKKEREARDFEQNFRDAQYLFADGGHGMPANSFRQAMISACRTVGFKMTLAKLSLFIEADGPDALDATPLLRLDGKPIMDIRPARNADGGTDLRSRPLWKDWSAVVRIRFDEEQFSASDVVNLMVRVGAQVGVGEGRPDSRRSAGMGFGLFGVEPA